MVATIPVAVEEGEGTEEEESHGIVYWTPASSQTRHQLMRLRLLARRAGDDPLRVRGPTPTNIARAAGIRRVRRLGTSASNASQSSKADRADTVRAWTWRLQETYRIV